MVIRWDPDAYPATDNASQRVILRPALSPLVVRGRLGAAVPLTVADSYPRICASHHLDEDAGIPCRIVDAAKP